MVRARAYVSVSRAIGSDIDRVENQHAARVTQLKLVENLKSPSDNPSIDGGPVSNTADQIPGAGGQARRGNRLPVRASSSY